MNRNAKRKAAQTRRNVVLIVALMLVVCVASIGGTIAWLTDTTDEVVNTFSPSGIDITLTETKQSDGSERGEEPWSADLVPGKKYSKNPIVSVNREETTVDIYLFVKFEELGNTDLGDDKGKILVFDSTLDDPNSGWTQGSGSGDGGNGVPTNVWYRIVEANATELSWQLLAGEGKDTFKEGLVTVNANLTKEDMPDGTDKPTPSLKYTAYAIQKDGMSNVGDAWNKINFSAN